MRPLLVACLALVLSAQPLSAAEERAGGADAVWLPGAGQRYEELLDQVTLRATDEPGEYRLAGDGFHKRWDWINRDLEIGPDGSMWVLRNSLDKVFRVGKRTGWTRDDGIRGDLRLAFKPGGRPVLVSSTRGVGTLAEGEWRWTRAPLRSRNPRVVIGDGEVWITNASQVARHDGSAWTVYQPDAMGITMTLPFEEGRVTGLGRTSDGSVWVGMEDRNHRPAGLARFDGESWTEVLPFGGDERIAVVDLAAGRDGTLWVRLVPEWDGTREHVARWDGASWEAWLMPTWLSRRPTYESAMTVAPDGRAWFTRPLTVFDGETWSRFRMPGPRTMKLRSRSVDSLTFAPDGNVWMLADAFRKGSRVLMLDLEEVDPVSVEPAEVYEPPA